MKNSLLWRITPAAGDPVSYLFGTMHVRDLRAFEWLDTAQSCLERCSVFATEFDFSETDAQAIAQVMLLPEGPSLDQLLGPGTWKNLEFYCRKKLNLPAEQIRFAHPLTVTLALTNALLAEETSLSLDETLYEYARGLGKETTGVESFEAQLQTLRCISFEKHLKNLTWLLKNYSRQKRRLKKMVHWYRNGAVRELYKAAKKDAKGMRKILLFERNVLMVDRFVKIARENSLFCAVGAGHLAGKKGMLRLLKKEGFHIHPVLP
jgi:uncharacterized protein YbaP (TraB family)